MTDDDWTPSSISAANLKKLTLKNHPLFALLQYQNQINTIYDKVHWHQYTIIFHKHSNKTFICDKENKNNRNHISSVLLKRAFSLTKTLFVIWYLYSFYWIATVWNSPLFSLLSIYEQYNFLRHILIFYEAYFSWYYILSYIFGGLTRWRKVLCTCS